MFTFTTGYIQERKNAECKREVVTITQNKFRSKRSKKKRHKYFSKKEITTCKTLRKTDILLNVTRLR